MTISKTAAYRWNNRRTSSGYWKQAGSIGKECLSCEADNDRGQLFLCQGVVNDIYTATKAYKGYLQTHYAAVARYKEGALFTLASI